MSEAQTGKRLKIFFVVEPGPLEVQAHLLIASLRVNCRDDFVLHAFCRAERVAGLQTETRAFLASQSVELTAILNDFPDGYPAGNKLIAANAVSGADWFLFLDTDMVMMRPASILAIAEAGRVAMCLDTLNGWSDEPAQWDLLFGAFGQPVPTETLAYPAGPDAPPMYNAGLVLFPDCAPEGRHFGQQWLETARILDQIPNLRSKRPWLDTIALLPTLGRLPNGGPVRLDLLWNSSARFAAEDVIIIHYHGLRQLKAHNWLERVDKILAASPSPYDSVWGLCYHYKRDLKVEGDLFRRAMRHGLQTLVRKDDPFRDDEGQPPKA